MSMTERERFEAWADDGKMMSGMERDFAWDAWQAATAAAGVPVAWLDRNTAAGVPREPTERPRICGEMFGVTVDERYAPGRKTITICVEDDDNWFESQSFDSYWLPDLIGVLTRAAAPAVPREDAWGPSEGLLPQSFVDRVTTEPDDGSANVIGGLDSQPPEAAGSDKWTQEQIDRVHADGERLLAKGRHLPTTDLATGLNATNDLVQCPLCLYSGDPKTLTAVCLLKEIEQLQRERDEAVEWNAGGWVERATKAEATIEEQRRVIEELEREQLRFKQALAGITREDNGPSR